MAWLVVGHSASFHSHEGRGKMDRMTIWLLGWRLPKTTKVQSVFCWNHHRDNISPGFNLLIMFPIGYGPLPSEGFHWLVEFLYCNDTTFSNMLYFQLDWIHQLIQVEVFFVALTVVPGHVFFYPLVSIITDHHSFFLSLGLFVIWTVSKCPCCFLRNWFLSLAMFPVPTTSYDYPDYPVHS